MLAAPGGGRTNVTSGFELGAATITINVSAPDPVDGSRRGMLLWRGRNSANGHGIAFSVLRGETQLDLRVLVDRTVLGSAFCGKNGVSVDSQSGQHAAFRGVYNMTIPCQHARFCGGSVCRWRARARSVWRIRRAR